MLFNSEIKFSELEITPQKINLIANYNDQSLPLWFEFDRRVKVSSSNLAVALSTLCGKKFEKISFDFEVRAETQHQISKFTGAAVEAPTDEISKLLPQAGNHIVSFSGGFDSIAVSEILGKSANLVSLDFGGWFERETDYFKKYDTLVISTNIRRQPSQKDALARNHWSFMATGAILTAEYFEAEYHSFGTILGATFAQPAKSQTLIPLQAVGLKEIPVTSGITEIGTTRIMLQTEFNEVVDSLKSLAGVRDRKNYYKKALVTLVANDLGIESPIPPLDLNWQSKVKFNNSYTTALSALYFIARGKAELISPLFEEIPETAYELASELKMHFMNRANYDYYQTVPTEIRKNLVTNLDHLGFSPYTEHDWEEIQKVRQFLATIF